MCTSSEVLRYRATRIPAENQWVLHSNNDSSMLQAKKQSKKQYVGSRKSVEEHSNSDGSTLPTKKQYVAG
jgi:hypothetical protein